MFLDDGLYLLLRNTCKLTNFTQELTGFRRADRKIRIVKIRGAELLFHLLDII